MIKKYASLSIMFIISLAHNNTTLSMLGLSRTVRPLVKPHVRFLFVTPQPKDDFLLTADDPHGTAVKIMRLIKESKAVVMQNSPFKKQDDSTAQHNQVIPEEIRYNHDQTGC